MRAIEFEVVVARVARRPAGTGPGRGAAKPLGGRDDERLHLGLGRDLRASGNVSSICGRSGPSMQYTEEELALRLEQPRVGDRRRRAPSRLAHEVHRAPHVDLRLEQPSSSRVSAEARAGASCSYTGRSRGVRVAENVHSSPASEASTRNTCSGCTPGFATWCDRIGMYVLTLCSIRSWPRRTCRTRRNRRAACACRSARGCGRATG